MAKFNELIKSGKVKAAYLKRQATLEQINRNVLSINNLDQETPNVRTFIRLESNADKTLEQLKVANIELDTLLFEANPDFRNEENYIADQKLVIDKEFSLLNAMEDYIKLLHSKDIAYPPEVKPVTVPTDLYDILNNLVTSQNKNAQTHDKRITTLDKNLTDVLASQNKNVADLSKSLVDQIKSHKASSKTGT